MSIIIGILGLVSSASINCDYVTYVVINYSCPQVYILCSTYVECGSSSCLYHTVEKVLTD